MKMKHLIIEGICDEVENTNIYPCNRTLKMGVHCFECSKFSYTFCPNEIAISDEEGEVEECIGFGGDMEPNETKKREKYVNLWKKICKKKIDEAYDEFMDKIKYI